MAKEEEATEAVDKPKSGKKKLFVIIALVALLVILVGGGAVAYMVLSAPAEEGEHVEEAHEEEHPPIYEKLETFTVNLSDQETYLQVEIHLLVAEPAVQEKLKQRMPEVRDGMIRLLSSKLPDELATQQGKDALADEIKKTINAILAIKEVDMGVKKVLFNSFIIQ
jgi:flagellar FliL protein